WYFNQVFHFMAVVLKTGKRIQGPIMTHCYRVHISRSAAVFIKNRAVIRVSTGWQVIRDHMQVFQAFRRTLTDFLQSFEPFSVFIDRAACKVIDRLSIPSQLKAKITVAELIEHTTFLRRLGGDPANELNGRLPGVETEQVTGV